MIEGLGNRTPLPPLAAGGGNSTPVAAAAPVVRAAVVSDMSGLAHAAQDLAQTPPVDSAKVAALRSAIAGGRYKVDPDAIAAKMIETDLRPFDAAPLKTGPLK